MANSEINFTNLKQEETSSALMGSMLNINQSTNTAQWGNEQSGSLLLQSQGVSNSLLLQNESTEHTTEIHKTTIPSESKVACEKNPCTKIYIKQGKRFANIKRPNKRLTNIKHPSNPEKSVTFRNVDRIPKTANLLAKICKPSTGNNLPNTEKNDQYAILPKYSQKVSIGSKKLKTQGQVSTKGSILNVKISDDHFNKDHIYRLPTNIQNKDIDKTYKSEKHMSTSCIEKGNTPGYEKDLNQFNAKENVLVPQTSKNKHRSKNSKFLKSKFGEEQNTNPTTIKKPRIKKQRLEIKEDIQEAPIEILNIKNHYCLKQCKIKTSRKVNNKPKKPIHTDPMESLLWKDGIGTLDDTNIHLKKNEFGLYEVFSDMEYEGRKESKYNVPLAKRKEIQTNVRTFTPDDIYQCLLCLTTGLGSAFISPQFCSHVCADIYKDKKHETQPNDFKYDKSVEKNSLYPWMHSENGFSWSTYLNYEKSEPAPIKLFKNPFPVHENAFKIGMKLEAVDPNNESYICVVTVVDVKGYRICLHFDSYSNTYNFWVNADSSNIFPVGWCEKNNHILQIPSLDFDWYMYMRKCRTLAAPASLFQEKDESPHAFQVGMKLEALDRKNTGEICVATVTDTMISHFLVHFDSQDEMYDYWVDPSSPYIHPIGWCQQNNATLIAPADYIKDNKFDWYEYLKESNSIAAPAQAFRKRPLSGFQTGMKIEAVDIRVPYLIRVATVADVKDHSLKVSFDGWSPSYSFWVDDDNPDIHPVGWCMMTGHQLEPPLVHKDRHLPISQGCNTQGCMGLGNAIYPHKLHHIYTKHCPYSLSNLNERLDKKSNRLQTRKLELQSPNVHNKPLVQQSCDSEGMPKDYLILSYTDTKIKKTSTRCKPVKNNITNDKIEDCELTIKSRSKSDIVNTSDKPKNNKQLEKELSQMTADIRSPVFNPEFSSTPSDQPGRSLWLKYTKPLADLIKKANKKLDPRLWTIEEVSKFVGDIKNCSDIAYKFEEQQIDGESFIMLTQMDLILYCGLKLGPAIKIYNSILALRELIPR